MFSLEQGLVELPVALALCTFDIWPRLFLLNSWIAARATTPVLGGVENENPKASCLPAFHQLSYVRSSCSLPGLESVLIVSQWTLLPPGYTLHSPGGTLQTLDTWASSLQRFLFN